MCGVWYLSDEAWPRCTDSVVVRAETWTFRASGSAVFVMRRGVGPQGNVAAGVTLRF